MTDPFEQAAHAERSRHQRRHQEHLRTGLRMHAAVFVIIQLLLVATWALTGAGFPWFVFPLLGWGAGLAGHALAVLGARRTFGDEGTAQ